MFPFVSLAAATSTPLPPGPQSLGEFIGLLDTIANWIFAVLLGIAVVFIILAALQFVMAGGDPAAVSQARQKLVYAVIGIIVAVASKGIVTVASKIL